MSYCRWGEGSDFYLFRGGGELHLIGPGPTGPVQRVDDSTDGRVLMRDVLLHHRHLGHEVRQDALDRLQAEIDGVPFETDVERAVRELTEEGQRLERDYGLEY
jgi:hypothetical protein